MEMPFGKHKGTKLEDIPKHYLLWVLDHCVFKSPTLKGEIEKILGLEVAPTHGPRPSVEDLKPVYRRMASKYHPDRGGSTEAMVAVNEFWDEISKALRRASDFDFFA
jgi:uncharacterized protein (DUF3820 family)